MSRKRTLLLLTDFYYQAKGREYFREDIELSGFLRQFFHVCISHMADMDRVLSHVDAVLIRNSGPQMLHHQQLMALKSRKDLIIFNDLSGKGDIQGKFHLFELFDAGYPVIPTVMSKEELKKLGSCEHYLLKPLDGADSAGVKVLNEQQIRETSCQNVVIQPAVKFDYEVSFYFVGEQFHYALYAPDPQKRWELKTYIPSEKDVEFALKFIRWNTCKFGIQRVDACRLQNGQLLLMELEDYNPFLSLDLLQKDVKEHFLEAVCSSLSELMARRI